MAKETVLVVGAGVIGCSCAICLIESGFEVTVVDASHDPKDAASYGNAGMIVPSHFVPLADPAMLRLGLKMMLSRRAPLSFRWSAHTLSWMATFMRYANRRHVEAAMPIMSEFALRSRELTASFAVRHTETLWCQHGLSMVCRTRNALDAEAHLIPEAKKLGQGAELWDRAELQLRESGAGYEAMGAVHFPMDSQLCPHAYLEALKHEIRVQGGKLITGVRYQKVLQDGVETNEGVIGASRIVLAIGCSTVGSWQHIPVISGKGYSWDITPKATRLRSCAILVEDRIAMTQIGDSLRIAGGMQIGGKGYGLRQATIDGICESLPRYLPKLEPQKPRACDVWAGHRPLSADGLPLIGPTSRHPRLLIATGHGMMGLTLAAATGELIARAAKGEPIPQEFSPDRF